MKILLDTNFLVYCAKQKIDYANEISGQLLTFSSVIIELEKLKSNAIKKSDKDYASLAIQILNKNINNKRVLVIETSKLPDAAIFDHLDRLDVIATMDKELKESLNGKIKIMTIKVKKKIEIINS
jgi:rRNA-processing protein FCF1